MSEGVDRKKKKKKTKKSSKPKQPRQELQEEGSSSSDHGGEVIVPVGAQWKKFKVDPSVYDGVNDFGGLVEVEELDGADAMEFVKGLVPERFDGDDDDDDDDGDQEGDDDDEHDAGSVQQVVDDDDDDDPDKVWDLTGDQDAVSNSFVPPESMNGWAPFELHSAILQGLYEGGLLQPTPIQSEALRASVTRGNDVIGAAETGSGKTLAFALPILQALCKGGKAGRNNADAPFAIILCPTRELAMQVTSHIKNVAKYCTDANSGTPVSVVSVIGGMSEQKQLRLLSRRPAIVVGPPGRLWEMVTRKSTTKTGEVSKYAAGETFLSDLTCVRFFVVDEADAMMKTGRYKEVEQMLRVLPILKGSERDVRLDEKDLQEKKKEERHWKRGIAGKDDDDEARDDEANDMDDNDEDDDQGDDQVSGHSRPVTTKKRQTFLFSATLAISDDAKRNLHKWKKSNMESALKSQTMERILALLDFHRHLELIDLTDPEKERKRAAEVEAARTKSVTLAEGVFQSHILVNPEDKDAILYSFVRRYSGGRTIIFCNTVTGVKRLVPLLKSCNIDAHGLHASMPQRQRLKNLDRFRNNVHSLLVATDVAARGLDVPNVNHVIHFDVPMNVEIYVHRAGRTGRAGQEGVSVLLVTPKDGLAFDRMRYLWADKGGLTKFPLDVGLLPASKQILKVAKKIDAILHAGKKTNFEKSFSKQVLGSLEGQRNDGDEEEEQDGGNDDDEEHAQAEAKLDKHRKAELELVRQEMDELLSKPFLPKGMSSRYPTKTPDVLDMLSRAPSALQDLKKRLQQTGRTGAPEPSSASSPKSSKLARKERRKEKRKQNRQKRPRDDAAPTVDQPSALPAEPSKKKPMDEAAALEHKRAIRRLRKKNKRVAKGIAAKAGQ